MLTRRIAQGATTHADRPRFTSEAAVSHLSSTPDVESIGKVAGVLITVLGAGWVVIRFVFRPLLDDVVFSAWQRKGPDAERYMRDVIFRNDFARRDRMEQTLHEGVALAAANAAAITAQTVEISHIFQQVQQASQLLQGIPHLAGTLEGLATSLDTMEAGLRETNAIGRRNSEMLAAHAALLGERRQGGRRVHDPASTDETAPESPQ
jgi:hypothetical protein